jgi:hypothetical protein
MLRSEQDREYQEMVETDRRMQEEKQMVSYGVHSYLRVEGLQA